MITGAVAAYLGYGLVGEDKQTFLPGQTSHGHYQIETACTACHATPFGGGAVLQDACINCHGAELKAAHDSHPKSKFTDPRNADRVAVLDARLCVTCHVEHKPGLTHAMGVTLEDDFCFHCHADIADNRPSHRGFDFKTCATGGCHNFHDNTALYEDFLLKHLHEPALSSTPAVKTRNLGDFIRTLADHPLQALGREEQDAPADLRFEDRILHDWVDTVHAQAGVNCTDCHTVESPEGAPAQWIARPDHQSCARCHQAEDEGFLAGKHGMRLAQGLTPMTPGMARLPMKATAHERTLGCTSCHSAHRFDTRQAAVDSCLACHNDEHSLAYKGSPHHRLWLAELSGNGPPGSGVSCATCHLPRETHREAGLERVLVQHNQNLNLRPNEKMIRGVCMDCHGLGFALDALADEALVKNNFNGQPAVHVQSLELAEKRDREKQASSSE